MSDATYAKYGLWRLLHDPARGVAHYNVMALQEPQMAGMEALRALFPDGQADELNCALFSTSGVHGTYLTIEDAEADLAKPNEYPEVTFLILHPRTVTMRYGNAHPKSDDDIEFLKKLRASSWEALSKIGAVSP